MALDREHLIPPQGLAGKAQGAGLVSGGLVLELHGPLVVPTAGWEPLTSPFAQAAAPVAPAVAVGGAVAAGVGIAVSRVQLSPSTPVAPFVGGPYLIRR